MRVEGFVVEADFKHSGEVYLLPSFVGTTRSENFKIVPDVNFWDIIKVGRG